MQIVVTDGHTLNPGDLSWAELKEFGDVTIYGETSENELLERIKGAEIILTNKANIYNELLNELPLLRYVGVTATGVNVVNLKEARQRRITVTNVPGYGTHSVAQHVFALILESTNNVGSSNVGVQNGRWEEVGLWSYWDKPMTELAGKCLGIIGMGAIGKQVATIGAAFGMNVIYHSPSPKDVIYEYSSLNDVFSQADYLSLNCPLNAATEQIVNTEKLSMMKPQSIVINTGRGQLINEKDLLTALQNGVIAGAGLDVLTTEPPKDNILIGAPNCIITPHHAWATREARQRLIDIVVDNLRCFLAGKTKNVVG